MQSSKKLILKVMENEELENKQKKRKLFNFNIIENEEHSTINNILDKNIDSEFIPTNIIIQIIKHYYPSFTILHKFSQSHLLIKINNFEFLNSPIENWQFNREPDMARCLEISRYIYNNKEKPIDTMFYVHYNNINKQIDMIDGIHRYTSLKILQDELNKSNDLLTGDNDNLEFINYNNDMDWFNNKEIIVNFRFNYTQEQLAEVFKTLNKSQPVPNLYIRDTSLEKLKIIEEIANEWQVKYPKHFSSSSNPKIGNTTRNKFIELLDKIYTKYRINETKVQYFRDILDNINRNVSYNIPDKVPEKTRLRCVKSNCYVFLYKNDILEDMI
jgi:hypothetical protein